MDDDLELEGLLFDEEEKQNVFLDQEFIENTDTIFERWASWVNIVNN